MAQLNVRSGPDDVAAALRARAAQAGRSAEAGHRRILESALRPAAGAGFRVAVLQRRIRLPEGVPSTTDLLRQDRSRE